MSHQKGGKHSGLQAPNIFCDREGKLLQLSQLCKGERWNDKMHYPTLQGLLIIGLLLHLG